MTESEQTVDKALIKDPLVVVLKPSAKKKVFTDIESYRKFLETEVEFWNGLTSYPARPRSSIEAYLTNAQSTLAKVPRTQAIKPENALELLRSSCQQLQESPLFSETTEGRFVGELLKLNAEQALGAISYLLPKVQGGGIVNTSVEALRGFVETFFRFGTSPDRRARNVLADLEDQKKSLESALGDLQDRFLKLSAELSQKAGAHESQFHTQSADMNGLRDRWSQQVDALHQDGQKRLEELEHLYSEKLRLKGPAEHWQKLTKRYRTSGIIWSIVSGVLVIAGSCAGIWGLDFFQKALQVGQSGNQAGIQTDWSHILPVTIVFGVIISVWIFVIRTTVRLGLSGFHLVRDAVEREQLSHYYLALIAQGKTLDKEAQSIVLQSLFSRADTGLLKGESSPTMPGSLAEILKNLRS